MLIRRHCLEKIGGIESIRGALIDDCALARRVKEAGGRVWLGTSPLNIRSFREYNRATEIRDMIARSAFAQLDHSAWLLAGTTLGLLVTYVAPFALMFSGDRNPALCGFVTWLIGAALFLPTVREYEAPWWTAFCLPAIAMFYLYATVASALRYWSGRGREWKNRDFRTPAIQQPELLFPHSPISSQLRCASPDT